MKILIFDQNFDFCQQKFCLILSNLLLQNRKKHHGNSFKNPNVTQKVINIFSGPGRYGVTQS